MFQQQLAEGSGRYVSRKVGAKIAGKKKPALGGLKSILGGEMEETGFILPDPCCTAT
jgi:hypothetical protein